MDAKSSNVLFSNSILIFLARFFPQLAVILVIIFFSRQLETDVYGNYQGFWTQVYLLNTVACLGIPAFFMTYRPAYVAGILQHLKPFQVLFYICWVLGISGLFSYLQHSVEVLPWYLSFFFLLAYSFSSLCESLLIISRRYALLVPVNIVYATVFCLLHWLYLQNDITYFDLFEGLLFLCVVRLIVYLPVIRQFLKAGVAEPIDNIGTIRALWVHLGFYDVSQMFFKWIDKFIISLMVSAGVFAVYYNGTIDIPFIPLLLGAVGGASLMQLAGSKKTGNRNALTVVLQSSRLLSCAIFPLFFFLVFFRQELFDVVFLSKYNAALPIFIVSILSLPLNAYNLTTILQNHHKGLIINTGAVLDLLIALGLMYPFYKAWGLPGVAFSFVLSSYIQAVFYLYHTSRILQVPALALLPIGNWLVKLIIFSTLFIAFHYVLQAGFTAQNVLICGSVLVIVTITAALLIELTLLKRQYGETVPEGQPEEHR